MTPTEDSVGERRAVPRARRLWEKVQDNVRHLQHRMAREGERLRINQSLGRRVTRQVLALDDSVILERGGLVTPSAIAHARQSGVLVILLDAVEADTVTDIPA
ncbi:MAG TPA: hypothetical protein VFM14_07340 [Gemmatimonadales bacterium]|nr:hypothetical protein [Gemmatimonadales bacterium]